MQVNLPFKIKLIFNIKPFKSYTITGFSHPSILFYGIKNYGGKPIAFELIELNVNTDSLKLIKYLEEDFKQLFNYDPLLWLASVGTCPEELRKHLIPFHKES